jgi:hypothetical protein
VSCIVNYTTAYKVRDVRVQANARSHLDEVTVVFFHIGGNDRFGHRYLQSLDHDLVRNGARFHYVHSIRSSSCKSLVLQDSVQAYAH